MPHNILAEVRLPSDAVPGNACITESVVCTVHTSDVFSCLRAIAVRQSHVHHFNGLEPRRGCSRTANLLKCFILQTSSLQDRIHYIHYSYRTVREVRLCVHPLRLRGRLCHKCTSHFGTPLRLRGRAGVFRRREGDLLAAHLGRFPSSIVSSSLGFFYEAFPHSEVRRLWTILWCSPLSLLVCVHVPCGTLLYAVCTSSGADGRVPRLRSSSPTAIVSSTSSLSRIASSESLRSGAVGCVTRPRSSTWRSSLFSISFLFLSCILADRVLLLIDDPCARDFNFQVFKWRGQSLDWCRASCVVSPSS